MDRKLAVLRLAMLVLVAAALAAVSGALGSTGAARPTAAAPKPATAKQWKAIVAKAKKEGSVVLYTTQNPVSVADMAAKFKDRYGISVTVNRNLDAVTAAQVTAEFGSGKRTADVWISATKPHVLGAIENGWIIPAVGPNLFAKSYNRKTLAKPGNSFLIGAAVLGMAWNTNAFPPGLKDLPDILNPSLKGRIGVPNPTSPSFIDWYLWVQQTYGKNFLPKLAAQETKVYGSSLTMTQAVASGELSASPFTAGTAVDLKAQGAPISFKLAHGNKTWNAPFYAMVLKGS